MNINHLNAQYQMQIIINNDKHQAKPPSVRRSQATRMRQGFASTLQVGIVKIIKIFNIIRQKLIFCHHLIIFNYFLITKMIFWYIYR